MSKDSILKIKTFAFAVRIIKLHKYLKIKHKEFVVSHQILKAGTSIGAQVREAEHAESRKDFLHKINIGLKEANETVYWLELLFASEYISQKMFDSINKDAIEILKMLVASVRTIKRKNSVIYN